ncbi:hypothetical protein Brsp03_02404 [Brucella sp. NBRC 12951]|uniref:hypothetical protein n=1 Tax=Brucella sp. NBRC 12951 TaxID=3075479 RepID=UPI0030A6B1B6
MQFRTPVALSVFIGSYLPLSVILLAQDYDYQFLKQDFCFDFLHEKSGCVVPFSNPWLSIGIFIVSLLCFVLSMFSLRVLKFKRTIVLKEVKHIPSDLMNYTLPYVVSFMGVGYNDTGKFVGVIVFLAWMFWITYKSGQIILNPLLVVFGWRLYELTYQNSGSEERRNVVALSSCDMIVEKNYKYDFIQDVLVVKPEKKEEW